MKIEFSDDELRMVLAALIALRVVKNASTAGLINELAPMSDDAIVALGRRLREGCADQPSSVMTSPRPSEKSQVSDALILLREETRRQREREAQRGNEAMDR